MSVTQGKENKNNYQRKMAPCGRWGRAHFYWGRRKGCLGQVQSNIWYLDVNYCPKKYKIVSWMVTWTCLSELSLNLQNLSKEYQLWDEILAGQLGSGKLKFELEMSEGAQTHVEHGDCQFWR